MRQLTFLNLLLYTVILTGQNHSMKVDSKSVESVEQFKYLGRTLTNQYFHSE